MKRIILVLVVLAAAAFLRPANAGACDRAICSYVWDAEGNPAGYGCKADAESNSNCTATVSSCHLTGCGGTGVVSDADGKLLAVAEFCRGTVLQVHAVAASPAGAPLTFSRHATPAGHGIAD